MNAQFTLLRPSKAVRRVLKLSGLAHVLPVLTEAAVPTPRSIRPDG